MFKKMVLVLAVIILGLGLSKMSFAQESAKASDASEQGVSQKAVDVGNKICPVTGEKIDEATKATYEYQGKIYNFCCPMCIGQFKKDPAKYIKKVEEELQVEPKQESEHEEDAKQMIQGSETMPQGMHEGHHH